MPADRISPDLIAGVFDDDPDAEDELGQALRAEGIHQPARAFLEEASELTLPEDDQRLVASLLNTRLTASPAERDRLASALARQLAHLPTDNASARPAPAGSVASPAVDLTANGRPPGRLRRVAGWRHKLGLWLGIVTGVAGVVALVAGLVAWIEPDPPDIRVLDGDLTVGVVDFVVDDTEEEIPDLEDLALSLSNSLDAELQERGALPEGDAAPLSVDVLSSSEADSLEGSDFTARAARAQTLAERHGADSIASAAVSSDLRSVQPLVYVAPDAVPDALELSGLYPFGSAVVTRAPIDVNGAARSEVRAALTSRSVSLAEFLMGLERHANGEYPAAAANFERSLETWPGEEGRDLVMLFLGNTALKQDDLDLAREWYERGLDAAADPSPRLELALLEVRFHEQRGDCSGSATVEDMQEVQAGYEEIQRLDAVPPGVLFDLRVEFGLARTAVCLAVLGAGEYADAVPHYLTIIDAFEDGNDNIRDIAAESYGGLGYIAGAISGAPPWDPEICESASDCYRTAATLAVDEERQETFLDLAS